MSDKEQNKKINELNRRVVKLESALKRIDLDLEPSGRISNAFDAIEEHLDEHDKKLDQLQYDLNQANGKLDVILERITGLSFNRWVENLAL
jgi:peptidoglycan hydrolase CwlO-like protein